MASSAEVALPVITGDKTLRDADLSDPADPLKTCDNETSVPWFSRLVGPGLLACLADTDAGCLIVAAKSGADWSYSLLLLQFLLVPILYCAQELTVRLGIYTKMGYAACVKQQFGSGWAWATSTMLAFECVLAIISEMSGIAAVMELWGWGRLEGTLVAAFVILTTVCCFKYRDVEIIGITLGLFELIFVATMFWFHPSPGEVFGGMFTFHFDDPQYSELYTANVGAVIMPFMIYFQQSAVVARRLSSRDVSEERCHTMTGCCLTQLVMIGAVVTFAASRAKSVDTIQDMHMALVPVMGFTSSRVLLSLALVGGSLCAAFVVALAASWALCDCVGGDDTFSVDRSPSEAPRFYGVFFGVVGIGVLVLQSGVHLVRLNVFVELVNGLFMPITLGFLFLMASSELLPPHVRLQGKYKMTLGVMFFLVSASALIFAARGFVINHQGLPAHSVAAHNSRLFEMQ